VPSWLLRRVKLKRAFWTKAVVSSFVAIKLDIIWSGLLITH